MSVIEKDKVIDGPTERALGLFLMTQISLVIKYILSCRTNRKLLSSTTALVPLSCRWGVRLSYKPLRILILGLFPFLGSWKRKYLNCGNWIFTSDVIARCVINLRSSVVTLSLGNEPIYSLPNEIGIWVPRIWHQRQYRPIFYQPAENMAHEPKAKTWRGFRGLKFITLFALDKRSVPWPKRE